MFFVEEFLIFDHIFKFVFGVGRRIIFLLCFGRGGREVFYIFAEGGGDRLQLKWHVCRHWSGCWIIRRRCRFAVIFRWCCATIRFRWGRYQDLSGVVWRGRPEVALCPSFPPINLRVRSFPPIFFQLAIWGVIPYPDNFWFFLNTVVPTQQFSVWGHAPQ